MCYITDGDIQAASRLLRPQKTVKVGYVSQENQHEKPEGDGAAADDSPTSPDAAAPGEVPTPETTAAEAAEGSEPQGQPSRRRRYLSRDFLLSRGRWLTGSAQSSGNKPQQEWDAYGLPIETDDDGETSSQSDLAGGSERSLLSARPIYTGFMFAVGVGLALLIFFVAQANTQLLVWIGAALFIALGLDPVVRGLERLGFPRPVGVLVTMMGFVGAVATFVAAIAPQVTQQMTNFVMSLPRLVNDISRSDWFQRLDEDFEVQEIIETEVVRFTSDPTNITNALGGLFGVGTAILTTSFGMLIVAVLTLYFLASLPTMKAWAYRLAPKSRRDRVEYLGERILNGVGYYVMGQACVAVINGIVAYIAISIADVPFGALFAVIAGILAFIPLVGPVTGGTLVTLVALTQDWQTAATFAAIYFIYLQIEAYFVSPRVMSRAVKIPAAVAVIAVIAGGALLGILGALLAIPTAAALMLLIREVLITHQDKR